MVSNLTPCSIFSNEVHEIKISFNTLQVPSPRKFDSFVGAESLLISIFYLKIS